MGNIPIRIKSRITPTIVIRWAQYPRASILQTGEVFEGELPVSLTELPLRISSRGILCSSRGIRKGRRETGFFLSPPPVNEVEQVPMSVRMP